MNARPADAAQGQILLNLPAEEYHRRELGVASNSVLKLIRDRSPAQYRAWLDAPAVEDETPAMAFGRAYHCRALESERYAAEYVVLPPFGDLRSSTNRAARDAWLAERPGVTVISKDDAERIEAMHAALMAHPLAKALLCNGECEGDNEVTLRWMDEATGVQCKARADRWLRQRRTMVDLKTTDNASPSAFSKSAAKYGYHIQQAHYCEGARAAGEPADKYLIVAQEKAAPYLVAVYQLDAASETLGYEQRQQGMRTMAECIAADEWPGYSLDAQELSLPAWAFGEVMEISYVD